ncbi:MAG: hypothetical protein AB2L24_03280 [Mangrovibacterium sp.]
MLNNPVQDYAQFGLEASREQIYRMITLGMAYRLSGDKRFARKGETELVNVCNYPSWDPPHFLDVAEMSTAVGHRI